MLKTRRLPQPKDQSQPAKLRKPRLQLVPVEADQPETEKRKATRKPKSRRKPAPAPMQVLPPVALTAAAQAAADTYNAEPYWLHTVAPPLPRSYALTLYRKPGLLGLIGSWLRQAGASLVGGTTPDRRKIRPWEDRRNAALQQPSHRELMALRLENERLRQQLAGIDNAKG